MFVPPPKVEPKPSFMMKELDRSHLHDVGPATRVGRGTFGVVYKGHALGELNGQLGYYEVAVKGLRGEPWTKRGRLAPERDAVTLYSGSNSINSRVHARSRGAGLPTGP